MIRKAFGMAALVLCTAMSAQSVAAQDGFKLGYVDIGPTVGIGGLGSASAAFGARFERGVKELPNLGGGTLGIQVGVNYYSWSSGFFSVKYIPIGVTANYHFKIENTKLDPFVGLGLGYTIVTCDYTGLVDVGCDDSAIDLIARAGARYFFSPKMALYGDIGAGGATANFGVMFKLK